MTIENRELPTAQNAADQLENGAPEEGENPPTPQEIADQTEFATLLVQATRRVYFTPIILAANVIWFTLMAVFGVGLFDPTSESLIRCGADFGPLTMSGQWWRLFTNTFVHIGIIHLCLNMWVLYDIGRLVERLFGNLLFIFIYLAAGILGSIISICINPELVSAGASGAIFGLYGALLGFSIRQKNAIPKTVLGSLLNSSIGFIGYNVYYGFSQGGIDNSAHLGGLLCGVVLGLVAAMPFDPMTRKASFANRMILSLATFIALIMASACFMPLSTYSGYNRFLEFLTIEEVKANASYSELWTQEKNDRLTDGALADKFETDCLRRWVAVSEMSQNVHLPESSIFRPRFDFCVQVVTLRTQALRKMITGLRNNDLKTLSEGMSIQQQADQLIEQDHI